MINRFIRLNYPEGGFDTQMANKYLCSFAKKIIEFYEMACVRESSPGGVVRNPYSPANTSFSI